MTDAVSFDTHAVHELAQELARSGARFGGRAHRLVGKWGLILQTRVRANASGRPGPRAPTGDYRRSIALEVGVQQGASVARVGTVRPQGRRLEFGFHGSDSLGRSYDQPAFPHFGPAASKTDPEFTRDAEKLAAGALDEGP